MWTIKQDKTGFYLTFDKTRRFFQYALGHHSENLPGQWELIGRTRDVETDYLVRVNQEAGYYCLADDEGGVRALILTEEKNVK